MIGTPHTKAQGIFRLSQPSYITLGISQVASARILSSPTALKTSNIPTSHPFRPMSSCEPEHKELSETTSPYKTKQTEQFELPKPRKPNGLKLVDKNRKKRDNSSGVKNEYENVSAQQDKTRHETNIADQLKKQNGHIQAQVKFLKEQFERKTHQNKAAQNERIFKMELAHEQRYNQLMRKYMHSDKQKELMRGVIKQMEAELKRTKEQNFRLHQRIHEVAGISQRLNQVEFHCKNLELQLEKDAQQWKQEKWKLEQISNDTLPN